MQENMNNSPEQDTSTKEQVTNESHSGTDVTQATPTDSWVEMFRAKFHRIDLPMEAFIRDLIAQERKKAYEEGEEAMKSRIGDLNDYWKRGQKEAKREVIEYMQEKIQGMRGILWHDDAFEHNRRISRENTLNEVLAIVEAALTDD
jgi:hypothetical protein